MTYCFVWNLERQSASFSKPGGRSKIFLKSEEWHQYILQKDTTLFFYAEGNVKSPRFNSHNSHYKKKEIFQSFVNVLPPLYLPPAIDTSTTQQS